MTISLVLFYLVGALALGGALGVVMMRNLVHAAFALLLALIGVAGLFLLAFAELLALVQVVIYGGAITIVVLFTLMLIRSRDFEHISDSPRWPIAALLAAAMFGVLAASVVFTGVRTTERERPGFEAVGDTLFVQWAVPLEVASPVLLVALVGSVVMFRGGRRQD